MANSPGFGSGSSKFVSKICPTLLDLFRFKVSADEDGNGSSKLVSRGLDWLVPLLGGEGGGEGGASNGLAKGLAYPGTEGIEGTCGSCLPLLIVLDLGVELELLLVVDWLGGLNVDEVVGVCS